MPELEDVDVAVYVDAVVEVVPHAFQQTVPHDALAFADGQHAFVDLCACTVRVRRRRKVRLTANLRFGQGDGAVPELLAALVERNYRGFLTLEPHLKVAGHSSGYSGPDGMRVAANALKALIEQQPGMTIVRER